MTTEFHQYNYILKMRNRLLEYSVQLRLPHYWYGMEAFKAVWKRFTRMFSGLLQRDVGQMWFVFFATPEAQGQPVRSIYNYEKWICSKIQSYMINPR